MKFLDFSSLLTGAPAHVAFLSTFQFDPDYFERRLLRCEALSKARRIVIFIDARQWFDLLRRDVPARWLNRRYLVVPVNHSHGVFHPKLTLLLSESNGQILCGSNNLTRSGCSSNLELLNALPFDFDGDYPDELNVAREAIAFFTSAAKKADEEIARIAVEWIDETLATYAWLKEPVDRDGAVRLIHTYDGKIWDRLVRLIDGAIPREFFVVSPFHDADHGICRRLAAQWPQANIELLVQQGYTNLVIGPLKKLRKVKLSELRNTSRRAHAKLLAWRTTKGTGCLVGSANFTSAAFDGRNVEACFLLNDAEELVADLFDHQLSKRPLAFDDFIAGNAEEPEPESELPSLRINSALLTEAGQLRVNYSHALAPPPQSLRLTIRTPGETRPRLSLSLPKKASSAETLSLPDNAVADTHGTLLATLVAESAGSKVESLPVWIIQESRLTYEPGEGSSSSKSKIEDTGDGLSEYLDELGKRDGMSAVVDYLRHLNIRFHDGGAGGPGQRKFRLKIRDPFHADVAPAWLIEAKTKAEDLEAAIYEFVERHEKRRLRKHVERGNINGIENFLDIFTTLIRLLYVYYKRGVVKKGKLIGPLCTFIQLATSGSENEKDPYDGYLFSIYDSLSGDVDLLQEVCSESNYLAEVRAALLIVQSVRFDPNETSIYGPKALRPREVLQPYAKAVAEAIKECNLDEPEPASIRIALTNYRMFSDTEITHLLAELPRSTG